MPSRREVRSRLPEAYWKAADLIQQFLYESYVAGSKKNDSAYREALKLVSEGLERRAERLARSKGCNERP